MFERILVPLDGSPLAEEVLPYAKEMGRRFDAEVILLQVVSTVPPLWAIEAAPGVAPGPDVLARQMQLEAHAAEEYLRRMATVWDVPGARVRWEVKHGVPADEIVRYAQEHAVSLIAMSTHGRTGLARLVLGSVADQVLRQAGVPVLLIRPKF